MELPDPKRQQFRFVLTWTFLSALGECLGFGLLGKFLTKGVPYNSIGIGLFLGLALWHGGIYGFLQSSAFQESKLSRRRFSWTLLSGLGGLSIWGLAWLAQGKLPTPYPSELLNSLFFGAIGGTVFGGLQCLALRGVVLRFYLWIPLIAISWVPGMVGLWLAGKFLDGGASSKFLEALPFLAGAFSGGSSALMCGWWLSQIEQES